MQSLLNVNIIRLQDKDSMKFLISAIVIYVLRYYIVNILTR